MDHRCFRTLLSVILLANLALVGLVPSAHANCTFSGIAIDFGAYSPLNPAPLDTTGSLIFQCNQRDHNVMITLSRGSGSSFAARRMVSGSSQLFYNMYLDAGRTVIWGDGSGGSQAYLIRNPQPNNQNINIPIFGRILPGQSAKVGNYSDTIVVTMTF
jgi:spore coat protein U-like protein